MVDLTMTFEAHRVRMVLDAEGAPWWIAKDVCGALGLSYHRKAAGDLPSDETMGVTISDPRGRPQKFVAINEPGLYRLIFKSRKPEAERFKTWVFRDVLPRLRRGDTLAGIAPGPELDVAADGDFGTWLGIIREARISHGKAAARALWRQSPLPALPLAIHPPSPLDADVMAFSDLYCDHGVGDHHFTAVADLIAAYRSLAPRHGWQVPGDLLLARRFAAVFPARRVKRSISGYAGVALCIPAGTIPL